MKSFDNVDSIEIEKFDKVSQMWWDPKSEMGTLHTINPLRTNFIVEKLTMPNPKSSMWVAGAESSPKPLPGPGGR